MNLLWSFEFSPGKDAKGQEVKPDIWNYAQVREQRRMQRTASDILIVIVRHWRAHLTRSSALSNLAVPSMRKSFDAAS